MPDGTPAFEIPRIRRVLDPILRTNKLVATSDGTEHAVFPTALRPDESEFLRGWVIRERATRTVEIGLAYGISALHICEGLLVNGNPAARHVVLDPGQHHKRFSSCGLQLLAEAGLMDLIEFHDAGSEFMLPRFVQEGRTFDLGFIDGNHRFASVFVDLFYLSRLVPAGGVVILDDYGFDGSEGFPGIRRAVTFFTENLDWVIEARFGGCIVLRVGKMPNDQPATVLKDFGS